MISQSVKLFCGDSIEVLKSLPSESVHSLITDPPAGIGMINLEWDKDKGGRDEWIKWLKGILTESLRVLTPGAYAAVWAFPRTSHWTAMALEDSGFEIRDVITHVFGNGFPKNHDLRRAIQNSRSLNTDEIYRATEWIRERAKSLGLTNAKLDAIAGLKGGACHWTAKQGSKQAAVPTLERWQKLEPFLGEPPDWLRPLIKPAYQKGCLDNITDQVDEWAGWGTVLKPASEHWIFARKPISEHNLASNVLKFKTGALNIDASRIETDEVLPPHRGTDLNRCPYLSGKNVRSDTITYQQHPQGRFPTNFVLTKALDKTDPVNIVNQQSGGSNIARFFKVFAPDIEAPFISIKKSARSEKGKFNNHPTVKPVALMRYFCKLMTPPNGIVLDPFMGSGTTGVAALTEGFKFIGIEKDPNYFSIAEKRLPSTQSA